MLAINDRGEIGLIHQYRAPFDRFCWEIPAGTLDVPGEEVLVAAQRELREELGCEADQWTLLGTFMTSPGWSNQLMYIFEARRCTTWRAVPPGPRRPVPRCGGFRPRNYERLFVMSPRSTTPWRSPSIGSTGPSLTTADRYLNEYLQWLTIEKGRSRATLEAYRRDLVRLIAWMHKHHLDVDTVSEGDLEHYAKPCAARSGPRVRSRAAWPRSGAGLATCSWRDTSSTIRALD